MYSTLDKKLGRVDNVKYFTQSLGLEVGHFIHARDLGKS